MIECIKARLKLLAVREGLSEDISNNNNASMIERVSIAVNAILIKGEDQDQAVCLVCGLCPKIVCSDGNSKDTIHIKDNLVYDFESNDNIPSLHEFKLKMVKQMLRSGFFQNEKKENVNMLKLPIIMAPKLLRSQVNNDIKKRTLYGKEISYSSETLAALSRLIKTREIDIFALGKVLKGDIIYLIYTLY